MYVCYFLLLYLLACSITLYLVILHAIYIEFTVVIFTLIIYSITVYNIPSSWIVTNIYNTNSCVCMLVLSLIALSLQCVKFFYFVHRFREFCECFVV